MKGEELFITIRPGPVVFDLPTNNIVVTPHKPFPDKSAATPFFVSFPVFDLSAGQNDPDNQATISAYVKAYFEEVVHQMRQWVWRSGGRETTPYKSNDGAEVGWEFMTSASTFFPNQRFRIFERGGVVDLVNEKGSIIKMWPLDKFISLECSNWSIAKSYKYLTEPEKTEVEFVAYEDYQPNWSNSFANGLIPGFCEFNISRDLPEAKLNIAQVNQLLKMGKVKRAIYGPMRPPDRFLPAGKEVHYCHHLAVYLSPNRNDASWGYLGLDITENNWWCRVYKDEFPAFHQYIEAKQLEYLRDRGVYL
jgi:hypothetical protein